MRTAVTASVKIGMSEYALKLCLKVSKFHEPHAALHHFATLEEKHCGDIAHTVFSRHVNIVVDIEFADDDIAVSILLGKFFHYWAELDARAAPRSPKINDNGLAALDSLDGSLVSKMNQHSYVSSLLFSCIYGIVPTCSGFIARYGRQPQCKVISKSPSVQTPRRLFGSAAQTPLADFVKWIILTNFAIMEKSIQIDGVNINYDECGPEDGAPIILMHGWGCRLETLASIRSVLADKMHVYNIDLPGHGKSDEPPAIWGVEEYTQLVEKFIKMLGIDNPILLGHSFGGRISILLSSRNRVKKVLLVDAAGIKPHRSMKYYYKVYTYKAFKHLVYLFASKKRGEKILEKYRSKSGSADYAAASPTMRGILSKCVNEDLKHVMPDIKAPTLLIWGENDTATPLSDAKTMEQLIPDAGLVSFPGCGHYSFLDNPRGFRAVIKEFLKDELQ